MQKILKHLQKRLCLGTAFLLLVASASWGQPAAAQAVHTAPGEWAVGPIGIKSSNGLSYCSMKTSYANGHGLVIASDSKGAHSVAIDFGKKTISAGAQYYVTYQIGPVSRMMLAIAATNEVLIAQMGADPDFFDMMRTKDTMEAEFNGDTLRFSLKGAGAALASLDACVEASAGGQVFAPQKLATPEDAAKLIEQRLAVAAEIERNGDLKLGEQSARSSLADEIQRLQEENRRLRLENQAVSARLRGSDLLAAEKELDQLEMLERQERALKIENDRLKEMAIQAGKMPQIQPSSGAMGGAVGDAAGRTATTPTIAVRVPTEKPMMRGMSPPPPSIHTAAPMAAADLPPAFGGLLTEEEEVAAPPVVAAAAQVAPKPSPKPVAAAVQTRAALAVPVTRQILHMINLADLAPERAGGIDVWRWQAGDVLAAAQSWPLQAGGNMATSAQSYLNILKSRCGGDFAVKMANVAGAGKMRWQTAEAACIGGDQSSAAGFVFISTAGQSDMAIVAYESTPQGVMQALAERQVLTDALSAAHP